MANTLAIFKKGEDTPAFNGDATSATITGLAPNASVAAGDYQGAFSDGKNFSDKVDVPAFKVKDAVQSAPTVAATAGDASFAYTITAGKTSGGSAVTGYKLSYATDGKTWTDVDVASDALTGTVDTLTNGTEYQVKAIAINAAGNSADSAIVKVTPVAPEAPKA